MKRLVIDRPESAQLNAGVERERHVALLQRRVGLGVGVVVDAAVVGGGDHETDHALLVAELLHRLVAGVGIVEGQIDHRLETILLAQDALAEPAVIGLRQADLDLDARTGGEIEHGGREHAGDVDAHGVHEAPHQRDVAVRGRRHLLDAAAGIAGDAAADLLVGAVGRRDAAARHALVLGLVAQHRIVHVLQDLVERLGLIVVAVDVDDAEVLVTALHRLLRGMREQRRGVELGGGEVAEIAGVNVHRAILSSISWSYLSCILSGGAGVSHGDWAGGRPATSPAMRPARTPRARPNRAWRCSRSRRRSG